MLEKGICITDLNHFFFILSQIDCNRQPRDAELDQLVTCIKTCPTATLMLAKSECRVRLGLGLGLEFCAVNY